MARLVIQKEDILHNYRLICAQTESLVIPVLKANGYGLGAEGLFEILREEGVALMAVSRLEEALPLLSLIHIFGVFFFKYAPYSLLSKLITSCLFCQRK